MITSVCLSVCITGKLYIRSVGQTFAQGGSLYVTWFSNMV